MLAFCEVVASGQYRSRSGARGWLQIPGFACERELEARKLIRLVWEQPNLVWTRLKACGSRGIWTCSFGPELGRIWSGNAKSPSKQPRSRCGMVNVGFLAAVSAYQTLGSAIFASVCSACGYSDPIAINGPELVCHGRPGTGFVSVFPSLHQPGKGEVPEAVIGARNLSETVWQAQAQNPGSKRPETVWERWERLQFVQIWSALYAWVEAPSKLVWEQPKTGAGMPDWSGSFGLGARIGLAPWRGAPWRFQGRESKNSRV